ncbi:cation:proton antiporter [Candidatus Woesearchaeota archaeon]|nr:cation:proton antiporter [Candidatus Woesearchaeota archaeon]
MDLFFEIGVIVILAGLGAYLAKLTRQPLVPAYIIAGIIISQVLGLGSNHELIANLSEIGIAFLLFMVGLELEFRKIKDIGVSSSITATVEVAAVFAAGYFVTLLLGFTKVEAVYLGIVIAFSSTMIVIKLLSDKFETNTLHGRLIIGILVVQDIFAIIALSYLASASTTAFGLGSLKMLALVLLMSAALGKFVFPRIFEFAAKSQELLLATSLSVCFLFALIFSAAGLSIAVGAFVAGVLLANLPYSLEIVGRVKSLRDFFVILFFTSLGLQLDLGGIPALIVPLLVLCALAILLKPLVLCLTLLITKHTSRTSFITAVSLAQISEFSLIVVALGVSKGMVSPSILTLTIMLAITTMTFTSYFMGFEKRFYHGFLKVLKKLRIKVNMHDATSAEKMVYDVILCGYDRIGYSILQKLVKQERSVLVIEFNPDIIKKLKNMNIACIYGDIADNEVLDRIDIKQAKLVISTANIYEDNLLLLRRIKAINSYAAAIVTAHKIDEALELYRHGADYVILPHFLGGDMVSNMLHEFESNQLQMMMVKYRHINDLLSRKRVGQEHPTHVGTLA